MCHFITAALPESVSVGKLKPILKAHQQVLRPLINAVVEAQLPPGAQYLGTTRKHCDCGTALGWLLRQEQRAAEAPDLDKLRRKGWSEARIRRWQGERQRAVEKAERERAEGTPHEEAERWAAYLRALLQSEGVSWFALLLHWYRGDVETERICLRDTQIVTGGELSTDALLRIEEDVLYVFGR